MSKAKGIKEIAYVDVRQGGGAHTHAHGKPSVEPVNWFDCAGGGQVVVDERHIAYIGNMRNPHGTMLIDVKDPRHPKLISTLSMPEGTHSHKVRVSGDIMITNREALGLHALQGETPPDGYTGGLSIWDVSKPTAPKLITHWEASDPPGAKYARGVHRFDFDGRYAYISPTIEGYVGNIMMILDIEDMSKPKFVSGMDWSPPFPWPSHTCLRIPFKIKNRDFMVVTDEDVFRQDDYFKYPASFMWLVDITDEKHPMVVSTYQIEDMPDTPQPRMTGCHQPCEIVTGTEIPVAWFAHGLRIIDIANPHSLKEVAHFVPDVPPG